jgi:hypothetical protein
VEDGKKVAEKQVNYIKFVDKGLRHFRKKQTKAGTTPGQLRTFRLETEPEPGIGRITAWKY